MRYPGIPLLIWALAAPLAAQKVLPLPPNAPERLRRIEQFREKATQVSAKFEAHTYRNGKGESMPYRLFRPEKIGADAKIPLILYLHGAGGLGADNEKNYKGGNLLGTHLWALPETQARQAAFVVAPQTDSGWSPRRDTAEDADGITKGARLALEIVEKLRAELPVDPKRIYVMGNSMGGAGTWYVIAKRPELFAAAVPMCGGGDPATAPRFRSVPVWNFHGNADKTVPVERSREMVEAAKKAGGTVHYTEYPGVGHDVAQWAATEPALVEWVFAQRK